MLSLSLSSGGRKRREPSMTYKEAHTYLLQGNQKKGGDVRRSLLFLFLCGQEGGVQNNLWSQT